MSTQEGFQTVFVVDVDPDAVWEAIARPVPGEPPAAASEAQRFHLPGFEARCVALAVDPGRLLRVRKDEEPCKGTEIVVVLEAEGSGTRITVSQSGFGPWLPSVLETFRVVWNWIVADLSLWVERRVALRTHRFATPPPKISLGIGVQDRRSGLEVTKVAPGGFGERIGLRPGDLLLTLNDVRLLYGMQLRDLERLCSAGNEIEVVWARGRESQRARGRV